MWRENILEVLSECLLDDGMVEVELVTEHLGRRKIKRYVLSLSEWKEAQESGVIE